MKVYLQDLRHAVSVEQMHGLQHSGSTRPLQESCLAVLQRGLLATPRTAQGGVDTQPPSQASWGQTLLHGVRTSGQRGTCWCFAEGQRPRSTAEVPLGGLHEAAGGTGGGKFQGSGGNCQGGQRAPVTLLPAASLPLSLLRTVFPVLCMWPSVAVMPDGMSKAALSLLFLFPSD